MTQRARSCMTCRVNLRAQKDAQKQLARTQCASLLRTIFASLARAHERVRVQNVRDFPQTELDSEINAPFLLNEHGDPHFLFHNFSENTILNN